MKKFLNKLHMLLTVVLAIVVAAMAELDQPMPDGKG